MPLTRGRTQGTPVYHYCVFGIPVLRVLAFLTLFTTPVLAQTSARPAERALQGLSESFQKLVETVGPAVVQIVTRGLAAADDSGTPGLRTQRSGGSGVIVDPEGFILTNAHVIGAAQRIQVLVPLPAENRATSKSVIKPAGKLVNAQLVGLDRETDIAVLRIEEKGLRHLRFGDSENVQQGQLVFAFGSPFGLENTVTMGVVSSTARQIRPDHPMIYIQTDASINPGNSGGPLVDASGALVGINTFILSSTGSNAGLGFAAPSNISRSVYEQIRKHGRVRRGQIGIQAQTISPALAQALQLGQDSGVVVGDVAPKGPAATAGIEIRDVLLTLDGKPLENARQFGVNIYQKAGETVTLEVLRGKEKLTKQVAVLERPRDTEPVLSLLSGDANHVTKLGIMALNIDEKVTPLLPQLRKLSGVVVAGVLTEASGHGDTFYPADVIYAVNNTAVSSLSDLQATLASTKRGESVAVQIERGGQLQFLLIDIE